jgi:hypothetical protein
MDYLRTGEVDHFLSQESYVDLLGFIPHRPEFDSYVFAMREIELFRDAMADPSVYSYEGDLFVDALPYSSPNGGGYIRMKRVNYTPWILLMGVSTL